MKFEFLQKGKHTPRKKYLVYPLADVVQYFIYVLIMISAYIFCVAIGITFLWGVFVLLLAIVFCLFCYVIRTVSFDDVVVYCQGPFFKKQILWEDICCCGRFIRKSPHYRREFIYLSTKPLQDTRFLQGSDMPKVGDTLFLMAYRPAIAEIMREHGLKNI